VPTYRQIDFLRSSLSSIKEQDFDEYEVVITDDTPDDSVEEVVREYLSDSRWSYFRNANALGSPENWNRAISLSKAPLVKLLHHDDKFVGRNALGRFVGLMDDNPNADLGFSASRIVSAIGGGIGYNRPTEKQVERISKMPASLLGANYVGAPSATIYRRSLGNDFDKSMRWLVDVDFYIRTLRGPSRLAYRDEILIETATSAEHQVTEEVRGNSDVDIGEHIKISLYLNDIELKSPEVCWSWRRLFYLYGVYSERQLSSRFEYPSNLKMYFRYLFTERPLAMWGGRLLYSAYKNLAPSVRAHASKTRKLAGRFMS
tara:strand:- start:7209 stop:8156 length:948 start_codon:yes stop_codon:yes gene_type:complete